MTDIAKCRLAIRTFWKAYAAALKMPFDQRKAERYEFDDAEYLAINGAYGLLYGAPGWPYLKLHFTSEDGFYLCGNEMGVDEFLSFQAIVSREFTVVGLPFKRNLS